MQGQRIGYVRVSTLDQNPERPLEQVQVDRLARNLDDLRRLVVYPTTADKYFAPKPGTMPPTQPGLKGARPWSHTCFTTNSLC